MPTIQHNRKPPYGVLYVVWEYFRRKKKAIYVGQATIGRKGNLITIDKDGKLEATGRIRQHKRNARRGEGGEIDKHMGKVGIENFEFETLQIPYRNKSALNIAERKGIEDYDTLHPNGFNLTRGGQSGPDFVCDATRKKHIERHANMPPEEKEEINRKISEGTTEAHANKTQEERSEAARKRSANKTQEERSEAARKAAASKTQEERRASGKKRGDKRAGKTLKPNRKTKRVKCQVGGCVKQSARRKGALGYCWEHFEEYLNNNPEIAAQYPPCKEPGCDKRGLIKGRCEYHYGREYHKNLTPAAIERRRERQRKRRENRSPAEKERMLERNRERSRERRKNCTPAEKERRRKRDRERRRKRREKQQASK